MAAFAAHGHDAHGRGLGDDHRHERATTTTPGGTRLCAACRGRRLRAGPIFEAAYDGPGPLDPRPAAALPGVGRARRRPDAHAGVPSAIASSSSRAWLDRHLERLGLAPPLRAPWSAPTLVGGVGQAGARRVPQGLRRPRRRPARAASPSRTRPTASTAAKAAGMAVVAVPEPHHPVHNDFTHADLVVEHPRRPRRRAAGGARRLCRGPAGICGPP